VSSVFVVSGRFAFSGTLKLVHPACGTAQYAQLGASFAPDFAQKTGDLFVTVNHHHAIFDHTHRVRCTAEKENSSVDIVRRDCLACSKSCPQSMGVPSLPSIAVEVVAESSSAKKIAVGYHKGKTMFELFLMSSFFDSARQALFMAWISTTLQA
jgi:hypothetical protein